MRIFSILLFICAIALTSCSQEYKLGQIPQRGNEQAASVLWIGGDTTLCFLTDFFPGLNNVISITATEGMRIESEDPAWKIFSVITDENMPQVGLIDIKTDQGSLYIMVQRETQEAFIPMFAKKVKGKQIILGFGKKPDIILAFWQNQVLPDTFIKMDEDEASIAIPEEAATMKRSFLRIYAASGNTLYSDVLIPLEHGVPVENISKIERSDPHAQILYSLMVDRFNNGNPENDRKLNLPDVLDKVDYQGGDIAGITSKIKEGYFNDMGFTTIWISPIIQNPYDAWGLNKDPYTRFSGYHGYWPIYITAIDKRFGNDAELREMLDEAHKHGLNVILDYVANHMHIDSPTLKNNPDWKTPLMLADGRQNLELWDEQRLTTWFDTHIPSLDLERKEIYEPLTDSALYWIANYDFDGFRHDATKHIPEIYWRTLTRKMKERFPDRPLYQIGETYGSPQLIGSYVKTGMLDAQFDFNVYDRAIWNIASDAGSMKNIETELLNSLRTYGYHNVMGYISGNHDRPRFISLAGGALSFEEDAKAAGWKREITVGDENIAYNKLAILEAFIMTIPGVPCIYQGDEYGVPGGNDPDNRRMMQFDGYNANEQSVISTVKKLTKLRTNSLALIYGEYLPLAADDKTLSFARIYMDKTAVTVINNSPETKQIEIEFPYLPVPKDLKANFDNAFSVDGRKLIVEIKPYSFEVFTN